MPSELSTEQLGYSAREARDIALSRRFDLPAAFSEWKYGRYRGLMKEAKLDLDTMEQVLRVRHFSAPVI